ncbi:MAG TPA: DUF6754 domain-containing protein [Candidatus Dormibacteraeota bacterium]|nr:DUF6754 domain-containing protein [Candidatus Dormibacteraeota bacterium]
MRTGLLSRARERRPQFAAPLLASLLVLLSSPAFAASPETSPPPAADLPAPTGFSAKDRPGDSGNATLLTWKDPSGVPEGAMIQIRRAVPPAYDWTDIATVKLGVERYEDTTAKDGVVYRYEIAVTVPAAGVSGPPVVSDPVASHDNWFSKDRTNSFIASVLFIFILLISITMAKSGKNIFIRRIAGLNAIDEAIGRATEVGKKVLYIPGIQSMDEIQTIASISILGHVARATARYGADLDVANRDPLTFASAREVVRSAYLEEGRPDLFREEMVNYVTYDQFAFTAAVSARMIREKPAAIFLIGYFFAESLILAETGQSTGAIQIAGQADPTQLPFFVATCDYTLIGEELYAASAYLTREPILLGSMRAQDIAKGIVIVLGIGGIIVTSLGLTWFPDLFKTK